MKYLIFLLLLCFPIVVSANTITLKYVDSMNRVAQSGAVTGNTTKVSIKAAKNEHESFQVAVTSSTDSVSITNVTISDLIGPNGSVILGSTVELFRVMYVYIDTLTYVQTPMVHEPGFSIGWYADPLLPFKNPYTNAVISDTTYNALNDSLVLKYALPIGVSPNTNGTIWFDVYIPTDAIAGVYVGVVTITIGGVGYTIPVEVNVYNFVLPEFTTLKVTLGPLDDLEENYGIDMHSGPGYNLVYSNIERKYAGELVKHKVSPLIPPSFQLSANNTTGTLTQNAAQTDSLHYWIEDMKVSTLILPRKTTMGTAAIAHYAGEYARYLNANGWYDISVMYVKDEPSGETEYQEVYDKSKAIKDTIATMNTMITENVYQENQSYPNFYPYIDTYVEGLVNVVPDSTAKAISEGKKVWSYVAEAWNTSTTNPIYNTVKALNKPYWQIDRPLANYRVHPWIEYRYGMEGLLYFSTNAGKILNPWLDTQYPNTYSRVLNGTGLLFYTGTPAGFQGPVPSIRLKVIRDGIEDYEYMKLAETKSSRTSVMNSVNLVSSEWYTYTTDPTVIEAQREALANSAQSATTIKKYIRNGF